MDPFADSESLSAWACGVLTRARIAEVSRWRMLEYWMQVELYRAAATGAAGPWKHLGEYEQPYYTAAPLPGCRSSTKWIDLVFAEPELESPKRIVWVELKDIGRNRLTLNANLRSVGRDLAALYTLDPRRTREIWLNPPPHAVDQGRRKEWNSYAPALASAEHWIAQIVITPEIASPHDQQSLVDTWLGAFEKRAGIPHGTHGIHVARCDGSEFATLALVAALPTLGE